jgi:TM2 domain-containing membrane protein YozV
MERDFYVSPKPSKMMRFFWKAAGGDKFILEQATYSDQVKYMCLGGIIVATGLMAALAGGYAFYTIFEPRGSSLESEFSWTTSILSIVFGIFWGLMIFNLDRFIVSSTGKGDGTEAITWDELKGAIPRLILGAIIALTISKPVEIRMFKSEIDAALHEEQLKVRKDYERRTRANYQDRLALIDDELAKFEKNRADLMERIKVAEKEHTDQLQGRAGAPAGDGKLSQALERIKNNLVTELNEFDETNRQRITELNDNKRELILEMDKELAKNQQVASGLDGLLERIKLAHKIAGFWISLFITLLFLAIELTPIFFKLMLIKSPYDFLKENVEELMKAEQGIYIQYNYHKDKKGQERDLVKHLKSEKLLVEKKALLKTQEELTEYAIAKYRDGMMKKIDENPEAFIKVEDNFNYSENGSK